MSSKKREGQRSEAPPHEDGRGTRAAAAIRGCRNWGQALSTGNQPSTHLHPRPGACRLQGVRCCLTSSRLGVPVCGHSKLTAVKLCVCSGRGPESRNTSRANSRLPDTETQRAKPRAVHAAYTLRRSQVHEMGPINLNYFPFIILKYGCYGIHNHTHASQTLSASHSTTAP